MVARCVSAPFPRADAGRRTLLFGAARLGRRHTAHQGNWRADRGAHAGIDNRLPPGNATDLVTGARVTSLTKTLASNEVWVLRVAR